MGKRKINKALYKNYPNKKYDIIITLITLSHTLSPLVHADNPFEALCYLSVTTHT
jgi:hypothetical protein